MISSFGAHLRQTEHPRCNSRGEGGETPKWQWVNSKLGSFRIGFQIHKLNFEIILKGSFNSAQLSSNGHNYLFQLRFTPCLKHWTLEF